MKDCCPERSLQRSALLGLVAWAIAMLVAVATFLPADAHGQEIRAYTMGEETSEMEHALMQRLNLFIGQDKALFLVAFGDGRLDTVDQCVPDHGAEKCYTFERHFYLFADLPDHTLLFLVNADDGMTVAWFVRPLDLGAGGVSPFGSGPL